MNLYYYTQSELISQAIKIRFDKNQIIDTKYVYYRLNQLANNLSEHMSRDRYLEWTKYWKAFYKQVTEAIRTNKVYRKTSKFGINDPEEASKYACNREIELSKLRDIARLLMVFRTASKVYSKKAYLRRVLK